MRNVDASDVPAVLNDPHIASTTRLADDKEIIRTTKTRILTKHPNPAPILEIQKSYAEIAKDLAFEDFDNALLYFAKVPNDNRDEYIAGLIVNCTKENFIQLYEFINKNKSEIKNHDNLILSLLTFVTRRNPDSVMDLLKSRDTAENVEEFNLILKGYFGSGLHRNFEKYTESLNLIIDSDDRNRAFQATVRQVGPVELDDFMINLNSSNDYSFISSDSYFVLVERLLRTLDPNRAEAILPKIQDEKIKIKAIRLIENFKAANGIK
jgi:hypothetical protein